MAGRQSGEDPRGETVHTETQAGPGKEGQALRGSGQRCYHRRPLPASSSVDRLVGVCRDNGELQGQVGEGRRLEASVAEKVDSTGEGAQAAGQ